MAPQNLQAKTPRTRLWRIIVALSLMTACGTSHVRAPVRVEQWPSSPTATADPGARCRRPKGNPHEIAYTLNEDSESVTLAVGDVLDVTTSVPADEAGKVTQPWTPTLGPSTGVPGLLSYHPVICRFGPDESAGAKTSGHFVAVAEGRTVVQARVITVHHRRQSQRFPRRRVPPRDRTAPDASCPRVAVKSASAVATPA